MVDLDRRYESSGADLRFKITVGHHEFMSCARWFGASNPSTTQYDRCYITNEKAPSVHTNSLACPRPQLPFIPSLLPIYVLRWGDTTSPVRRLPT